MKKTWNKIILIFWSIIIIEVIAILIVLTPHFKMHKIYNDINKGKWDKVKDEYDSLTDSQKRDLLDNLDGYANKLTIEYIDGKKNYIETAASFDAINAIEEASDIYNKYMPDVNNYEYMKAVEELYIATIDFDSKAEFEAKNNITAVQQRIEATTRENLLIEMMNDKYLQYLNEEIGEDDIGKFATAVSGISFAEAHSYVDIIINNVAGVERYRALYLEGIELNKNNKSLTVLDMCKNISLDPKDTIYKERFDELYKTAYTCGKLFYADRLDKEIEAGNNALVLDMLDEIVKYYGDDFDIVKYKRSMANEWQKAYMEIANTYDSVIKSELQAEETELNILITKNYSKIKPDSMNLFDINSDGVPELFLYKADSDYNICFIFGMQQEKANYMGCVDVSDLCEDGYLIGKPITFASEEGEVNVLYKFDTETNKLVQDSMCQNVEKKYYVNGSATNDVEYLKAQSNILDHANGKTIEDLEAVSIEDNEGYVLSYK